MLDNYIQYDVLEPVSKRKIGYYDINQQDAENRVMGGRIVMLPEYTDNIKVSPVTFHQYLFLLRFLGKNDMFVKLRTDVPYASSLNMNADGTMSGNVQLRILDNLDALNELEMLKRLKQAISE